jgi:hypothetical protein
LAVAALAATPPISHLAAHYQVSRKFVYQQADQATQALTQAFAPDLPAGDRVLFWLPVTAVWLRRRILTLRLVGHRSYRGIHEWLRDLFHYPLSLGSIHHVAHAVLEQTRTLNGQQDLSAVGIGAHDEIFPRCQPVRVGVDVASTSGYLLSREEHRDGETWGIRLLQLPDRGFTPEAILGDGGSAVQAGQELALPQVPGRGDVFHVVREVTLVVTFLEKRAYQALEACRQLEQQQSQRQHRHGRRDGRISQQLR